MAILLSASECSSKKTFPMYRSPSVVAEFSVTKERDVVPGRMEARYFYNKVLEHGAKCHFDLNEGFETFQSKDELLNGGEKLNVLCKWLITRASPNASLKEVCCDADFVCYRGLLTRVASTPYDVSESWMLSAVRIESTIFLCEFPTEQKKHRIETMTQREKMMCYWGFKFEQFVTTDTPTSSPVTNEAVCNLREFDVVLKTTLGDEDRVRLLFSAETDCFDSHGRYLELKTQANGLTGSFWMNKAMKWWIQSFLAGIEQIVVGFRNNSGIVERVSHMKVAELYRHAVRWTPAVTFSFLLDTLRLVKQKMFEVDSLIYVLFEYAPSERAVTFRNVPEGEDYAQFLFLPDEFLEHFGARR
ncbi:Decapping nuclease dom-3 [Toxocara canis]|uniref:Decapping nuclease n=2 Tax=Toxocara canis TaxID=6265 RepID=A0A0B2V190_TOXCA|nr:Decapping nuclease dom-3 [Toxocara canis]VDM46561.1 unnamed protein product [Toxocara canis]